MTVEGAKKYALDFVEEKAVLWGLGKEVVWEDLCDYRETTASSRIMNRGTGEENSD
jgi:hypothetical protein